MSKSYACRIAANMAKKKSDIVSDIVNGNNKVAVDDTASSITTPAAGRKKPSPKKSKSTAQPNYWHNINDPFIIIANDQIHTSGILFIKEETKGEQITLRDQLQQHDINLNSPRSIKFTIRGNPRVLIRHRTARGFVYNPSKAAQENFKDCLLQLLPRRYHPTILDDNDDNDNSKENTTPSVLFSSQDFLKLSITFRMKRPKSHFISNKPGPNRLKSNSPSKYYNNRSDIDNLTKFVMDCKFCIYTSVFVKEETYTLPYAPPLFKTALNGLIYVDDKQVVQLEVSKVLDNDGECLGTTEVMISVLDTQ